MDETMDKSATADVLNGIAYDAENDRIFITGKKWNKLYEVKIIPKNQ
jgi:glutamine cyclotransferase